MQPVAMSVMLVKQARPRVAAARWRAGLDAARLRAIVELYVGSGGREPTHAPSLGQLLRGATEIVDTQREHDSPEETPWSVSGSQDQERERSLTY